MPKSRHKPHGKRPPPPAGKLRPAKTDLLGTLPEELRESLEKALRPEELLKLAAWAQRLKQESVKQSTGTTGRVLYLVFLRIMSDRMGADTVKLEEAVTLVDEYLEDIGAGRLKLQDLMGSLQSDGLNISEILRTRL